MRNKEIEICKVDGKSNLADALTKNLDFGDIKYHIEGVGCYIGTGRHKAMPEAEKGSVEPWGASQQYEGEE